MHREYESMQNGVRRLRTLDFLQDASALCLFSPVDEEGSFLGLLFEKRGIIKEDVRAKYLELQVRRWLRSHLLEQSGLWNPVSLLAL